MMKLVIGCDHAAFELKMKVLNYLRNKGYEVIDVGTHSQASTDYPIYAKAACEKIISNEVTYGVLICGTGIGMSIAANKIKGIRACACSETFSAIACREHNDANVICFGARVVDDLTAYHILDAFLTADFLGGRHQTRVDMITEIEE